MVKFCLLYTSAGDRRHVRRVGFQQKAVQWDSSGGLYRMAGVFKGYRASKAEIQSQLYRLAGGLDAARKAVENPFGLVLLQQLHGVPMGLPVMDNNGQAQPFGQQKLVFKKTLLNVGRGVFRCV